MKLWCNVAEMVSLLKHTSQWAIPEKIQTGRRELQVTQIIFIFWNIFICWWKPGLVVFKRDVM